MTYSVAGRLQFGEDLCTLAECASSWRQHCCNHCWKQAVLVVEDGSKLEIPKVGCFGDESRLCCNVPVRKQKVVATGGMRVEDWIENRVESWHWAFRNEVTLCAL